MSDRTIRIAPVRKSVVVRAEPARAFEVRVTGLRNDGTRPFGR